MKVRKKKVSFDIDENTLNNIRVFCENNNFKQSDFYREAVERHFRLMNDNKEIFYFDSKRNKMKKLLVDKNKYDIETFDADDLTKIGLNVSKIVSIRPKNGVFYDDEISKILKENNGLIKGFEK